MTATTDHWNRAEQEPGASRTGAGNIGGNDVIFLELCRRLRADNIKARKLVHEDD